MISALIGLPDRNNDAGCAPGMKAEPFKERVTFVGFSKVISKKVSFCIQRGYKNGILRKRDPPTRSKCRLVALQRQTLSLFQLLSCSIAAHYTSSRTMSPAFFLPCDSITSSNYTDNTLHDRGYYQSITRTPIMLCGGNHQRRLIAFYYSLSALW